MWRGVIVWIALHVVLLYVVLSFRDELPDDWLDILYYLRGPVWIISMLAMIGMLWIGSPVLWTGMFIDLQLSIDVYYVLWLIFGTLMFITPRRLHEPETD